jgi:hypothetical protein
MQQVKVTISGVELLQSDLRNRRSHWVYSIRWNRGCGPTRCAIADHPTDMYCGGNQLVHEGRLTADDCGAANSGCRRVSTRRGRLKAGCRHDCLPHSASLGVGG